jgi:hypothetical protein
MNDNGNTLRWPGRAQVVRVPAAGEKHPRVNWDEVGRGAGCSSSIGAFTPLAKRLVLQCNIEAVG